MADQSIVDDALTLAEADRVHFRIEFSVDRGAMDSGELSWEEFVGWLRGEYGRGIGHPGAGALLYDLGDKVKVSLRYRTETGGWDGVI